MKSARQLRHHTSWSEHVHNNPPAPFNPDYDPRAVKWSEQATAQLEAANFYATHTREECAIEWRKQYDAAKAAATQEATKP